MNFVVGGRYWSSDKREMTVVNRFDNKNLLRAEVGFGMAANYRIRTDRNGREWITAKGCVFEA